MTALLLDPWITSHLWLAVPAVVGFWLAALYAMWRTP